MFEPKSIHTLNARDNIMLEFLKDILELDSEGMFLSIQSMRDTLEALLLKKGVKYSELRTALTPSQNRKEIALVFDTDFTENSWYGHEVFCQIIPLFHRDSSHSVLCGDYLNRPRNSPKLFEAFEQKVVLCRNVTYSHPTQFFIVYINNLSDAMFVEFNENLKSYPGYCGYADMTYQSDFKVLLSTMLVPSFIKHKSYIIQGHEPDRDESENVNLSGYNFEENGYRCISISDDLAGVFLSYKIERPVHSGFEVDTEMTINSVRTQSSGLYDFEVDIAAEKMDYLKKNKGASLQRAGIDHLDQDVLSHLIKSKLRMSYIYNIAHTEHNVTKFNTVLEFGSIPTRLMASFEYIPSKRKLRLITFY